mgnify:CR=1 FL=1
MDASSGMSMGFTIDRMAGCTFRYYVFSDDQTSEERAEESTGDAQRYGCR